MKKILKNCIVWCLTILARLTLKKYKPVVIAVTGSVGKTSAKDAIFALLKEEMPSVRKSEKSFNSEIGVPLTILGCPNAWSSFSGWFNNIMHGLSLVFLPHQYPSHIVIEVGADHPGDIRRVAKWLAPRVVVMTKISKLPVHVEFFKNREELVKEKLELVKALAHVPGSTLVTYGDTEEMAALTHPKNGENGGKTIVYGTETGCKGKCDVVAKNYSADMDQSSGKINGIKFQISEVLPTSSGITEQKTFDIKIKDVLGITHAYPYLAACAALKAFGISPNPEKLNEAINENHTKGRMSVLTGVNGTTLIDDTYNSSPDAVESALSVIAEIKGHRKIAILGDMMELGNQSVTAHEDIGRLCHTLGIDILVTAGVRSERMAAAAHKARMPTTSVFSYTSSQEAADPVNGVLKIIKPGDIILIKGSQSARMEKVTFALLEESLKAQAGDLLVRQDEEWLKR